MAQIKQTCSVVNNSQIITILGVNIASRILKNHIFMDAADLVPYTVASDATFDGTNTVVTLTGAYMGKTNVYANGVFVNDYTYPDMIPTISQGDVGTAAVFTKAMYRLQDMIKAVSPDGLLQYSDMYRSVMTVRDTITEYASTVAAASKTAVDASNSAKTDAATATTASGSAQSSKDAAKVSETNSANSAAAAKVSETKSGTSESNAKTSEANAKASEVASKTSETNAAESAAAAKTSEANTKASEQAAKLSETNSKTSEANAKASETASATSATAANGSKAAAKTSEDNAKISETNSKTSETNAKASEVAAKASETNSASNATSASNSATSASGSASTAATKADSAIAAEVSAKSAAVTAKDASDTAVTAANVATEKAIQVTNLASDAANSAQLAANYSSQVTGGILSTLLSGLSTASSAVVSATDTIIAAFGKLQAQLSLKAPLENPTFTGTVKGVSKAMVGLSSADNTADVDKPVSVPQATALATKQDASSKDASGGFAGLTAFKLNLKNATGTILSFLVSGATAARTWTFPDKDGTVAMTSDIPSVATVLNSMSSSNVATALGFTPLPNTYTPTWSSVSNKPAFATVATTGSYSDLSNVPASYVLPIASQTSLGGVKLDGATITADANGKISVRAAFLDKGSFASGTVNISAIDAEHQKIVATGNITITVSNFRAAGITDELLLECVNFGGKTIAFPTISWIKPDGSFATTFATNGVTLQSSGTDFILIWTRDGGATLFGKVMR